MGVGVPEGASPGLPCAWEPVVGAVSAQTLGACLCLGLPPLVELTFCKRQARCQL